MMGLEHVDQALVLRAVLLQRLQLDPAGAERAARGMGEGADRRSRFFRGVDQIFAQRAEDAVAGRQHLDFAGAGFGNDGRGGGVDDGGHAAGLGVKQGSGAHGDEFCLEGAVGGLGRGLLAVKLADGWPDAQCSVWAE